MNKIKGTRQLKMKEKGAKKKKRKKIGKEKDLDKKKKIKTIKKYGGIYNAAETGVMKLV